MWLLTMQCFICACIVPTNLKRNDSIAHAYEAIEFDDFSWDGRNLETPLGSKTPCRWKIDWFALAMNALFKVLAQAYELAPFVSLPCSNFFWVSFALSIAVVAWIWIVDLPPAPLMQIPSHPKLCQPISAMDGITRYFLASTSQRKASKPASLTLSARWLPKQESISTRICLISKPLEARLSMPKTAPLWVHRRWQVTFFCKKLCTCP